jgi:hypothetical protein
LKIVAREIQGKYFRFNWSVGGQTILIVIYLKGNNKHGKLHNGEIYTLYWSLTQSISACKGDLIDNVLLFVIQAFRHVVDRSSTFLPKRNAPCIILSRECKFAVLCKGGMVYGRWECNEYWCLKNPHSIFGVPLYDCIVGVWKK